MRSLAFLVLLLCSLPSRAAIFETFDNPGSLAGFTLLNNNASASGFYIDAGRLKLDGVAQSLFFQNEGSGPFAFQTFNGSTFVAETLVRVFGANTGDNSLPGQFALAGLMLSTGFGELPGNNDWIAFGVGNSGDPNSWTSFTTVDGITVLHSASLLPNSSGPSPFANVGDYRFRLRIVRDMDLFSLYLVDPFGDASVLVNQYSNAAVGSAPALQVGLFAMDLEGGNLSAEFDYLSVQAVPVPASIWLFGSVVALAAFRHRRRTRVA